MCVSKRRLKLFRLKSIREEMEKAQKYQIDQARVDRKFCKERCAGWFKVREMCGTLFAPAWRKGKCMWENPRVRRI
jgi:hypothetical protein